MNALHKLTARQAVGMLTRGEITPHDLIDAAVERIAETDPALNALPTHCIDRAREHATRLLANRSDQAAQPGWLAGLPIAVKDLNDVGGVRTTYGSPLFANHVPERSDIMVEHLEANGAIVLAKSNTPELGHGATTFNEVFGTTRNPWDTRLTCGGSSGGSAVTLAAGQTWLATGSDLGCSLRTPAAFCGVVGLRPSPGRVARAPTRLPFDTLWVQGPMARNVGDVALMLDAMCGADPRDPISLDVPARSFVSALDGERAPRRIGYSADLGGIVPVAAEIRACCDAAVGRFTELGATVEEACPDFRGARDVFRTLRANQFVGDLGPIIEAHRDSIRKEVVWNYEQGLALTAADLARAERERGLLYERVAAFFDDHDLLVTPATIVAPFDADIRHVDEVEGVKLDSYFEWYAIAYVITLTSLPAISLPCGFTAQGLPVGLQLIGPPRGEAALLAAAAEFEELLGIAETLPIDPRVTHSAG